MNSVSTLEGVYNYKMDSKGRVSIPSDWRTGLGDGVLRMLRAKVFGLEVLKVLTELEFETVLKEIEDRGDWTPAQKRIIKGKMFSDCQKTKMGAQGKLLIPKNLYDHSGLEANEQVALVGRGAYFELVHPDRYRVVRVKEEEAIAELNEEIKIF